MAEPAAAAVAPQRRRRELAFGLGLLLLVSGAQLAPMPADAVLLHDDWPHFLDHANGAEPALAAGTLRPLVTVPWKLAGRLFGANLMPYHLLLAAANLVFGVLLYLLARRFANPGAALAFTLLALLWPADASRLWLSALSLRSGFLLGVMALLAGETSRDRLGPLSVLGSALIGAASLLFYELHFFVLALWPGCAALLGRAWPRRLVWAWAAPYATYLAWRFAVRPLLGAPTVAQTEWSLNVLAALERLLLRFPYNLFVDGWWIAARWIAGSPLQAVAWLAALLAAAWWWLRREGDQDSPHRLPWRVLLAGVALLLAGALPIVPTEYWLGRAAGTYASRVLAAALPGAALLALGAAGGLGRRGAAVAVAVALTFTAAFHVAVRAEARENWRVQEAVRRELPRRLPNVPPGSFLVVRGLPPNRLGYETPFGFGRGLLAAYDSGAPRTAMGFAADRGLGELLSCRDGVVAVYGGLWGRMRVDEIMLVDWNAGRPRRAPPDELASLCGAGIGR